MPGETCFTPIQANIFLFKVNNRSTRKMCGICSELTIKTPFSKASIVDFEQVDWGWDLLYTNVPLYFITLQIFL